MSRPVHWSSVATEHLAAIAQYVGRTSPTYAERLINRLLARVDRLAEFPELGRVVPEVSNENIRELVEPPYRIVYFLQMTRIDIVAVVHGRQHLQWPEST